MCGRTLEAPVERQPARVADVAVGDGEVVVRNELEVVVVKEDHNPYPRSSPSPHQGARFEKTVPE